MQQKKEAIAERKGRNKYGYLLRHTDCFCQHLKNIKQIIVIQKCNTKDPKTTSIPTLTFTTPINEGYDVHQNQ